MEPPLPPKKYFCPLSDFCGLLSLQLCSVGDSREQICSVAFAESPGQLVVFAVTPTRLYLFKGSKSLEALFAVQSTAKVRHAKLQLEDSRMAAG